MSVKGDRTMWDESVRCVHNLLEDDHHLTITDM